MIEVVVVTFVSGAAGLVCAALTATLTAAVGPWLAAGRALAGVTAAGYLGDAALVGFTAF